jgi:anti-sigma B factor antagonist
MVEPHDMPSRSREHGTQPGQRGPRLETQLSYRYGVPLVYVSGELDHHTSKILRDVISQELGEDTRALLLEVSQLSYMDSGGLSLMFETMAALRGKGWLGIVSPNVGVRKLAELTGLVDRPGFRIFPDFKSVPAAVAELSKQE